MFCSSSYDPAKETPDLTGKVAIVTGGNTGVGYAIVKHLASNGAKVYMASRNRGRAEAAITQLQREIAIPSGSIELLLVDLSLIKDVKRAADEFATREQRLDILVNNAALTPGTPHSYTQEGLVPTLAANHFGHFALTTSLLPILTKTEGLEGSDVRIVNVTSPSYTMVPPIPKISTLEDLDILKEPGVQNGLKRYALSKLCNIWFNVELQRRVAGTNIVCVAANPGGAIATSGAKDFVQGASGILGAITWPLVRMVSTTPDVAAYSSTFAATSVKVAEARDKYQGVYLDPPNVVMQPSGQAADESLQTQLWNLSERVVAEVSEHGHVGRKD